MAGKTRHIDFNIIAFVIVFSLYVAGQFFIGTYDTSSDSYNFTAPADIDFLYYAGIVNQLKHTFPPQNPAYGGVILSQSFIQYYPTVVISLLVNEYIAFRVMNIVYLVLATLVLRRYYRRSWGIGLIGIAAGSVGFGLLNSLGVDLIARGFNHFPFFIVLLIAVNESERKWLRYLGLFLLGWLHSYSAFIVLIYLVLKPVVGKADRKCLYDIIFGACGVIAAGLLTLGVADKPFYFVFIEGFGFDLSLIWMHVLLTIIPVVLARKGDFYLMYAVPLVFGVLFHYNPFFPVFLLYFVSALALMNLYNPEKGKSAIPVIIAMVLLSGFIVGSVNKYSRGGGQYYPHFDTEYSKAGEWLEDNTSGDVVLLAAPLDSQWRCRLMEKRAVFVGFISHVAHLGIDWRRRSQIIANYFANPDVNIADIDFVVYGPAERRYFPGFFLPYPPVYSDSNVTIWEARN